MRESGMGRICLTQKVYFKKYFPSTNMVPKNDSHNGHGQFFLCFMLCFEECDTYWVEYSRIITAKTAIGVTITAIT